MKIGIFAGITDKRDVLLYLCKILAAGNYKVLLVDATESKKYRYSVGSRELGLELIQFNGFDVATNASILSHWGTVSSTEDNLFHSYDIVLFDVECMSSFPVEVWSSADHIFWVTAFDRYDVERSVEEFGALLSSYPNLQGIGIRRLYIRTVESAVDEQLLMNFVNDLPLEWLGDEIYIPWNEHNIAIQLENEHESSLVMSAISRPYQRALLLLVDGLLDWKRGDVRRALRRAKRRRA
jgi:hypothetical protein